MSCHPAGISSAGQSTLTLLDLSLGYLTKQMNGSFIGVSRPRSFTWQLCLSKQSNALHSENKYSFILKKLEMYFIVVVLGLLSHPINNTVCVFVFFLFQPGKFLNCLNLLVINLLVKYSSQVSAAMLFMHCTSFVLHEYTKLG